MSISASRRIIAEAFEHWTGLRDPAGLPSCVIGSHSSDRAALVRGVEWRLSQRIKERAT